MSGKSLNISIVDYGVGNLHSLAKALAHAGANVEIEKNLGKLEKADCLILPGVGAFGAALRKLIPYREQIIEFTKSKPVLGICLGMQLLFEKSAESEEYKGLGLIKGSIKKLPSDYGIKIPHMGWNRVNYIKDDIFRGVAQNDWFYFAHSYVPTVKSEGAIGFTHYGERFVSVTKKGLIYGTQFHPEKSSKPGLKFLRNFVQMARHKTK